jgi:hypothetical protein
MVGLVQGGEAVSDKVREAIEDAVEYGDMWTAEFADSPEERAQWAENRATLLNLIKETT